MAELKYISLCKFVLLLRLLLPVVASLLRLWPLCSQLIPILSDIIEWDTNFHTFHYFPLVLLLLSK